MVDNVLQPSAPKVILIKTCIIFRIL